MDELKGLNVYPDVLLKHLEETKKSFPIEADIKSGSMLIPDKQKLVEIMTKRIMGFRTLRLYRNTTHNILAFEKVYADGGGDPVVIDRVDNIIDSFSFIGSSEAYKAKIEGSDCVLDAGGLPDDDGRKQLAKHLGWLGAQKLPDGSGTEAAIIAERHFFVDVLGERYFDLQRQVLKPNERLEPLPKTKGGLTDREAMERGI